MKKDIISIIALIAFCLSLASCGGEPVGDHTQPEATQGDLIRHDDLDTAGTAGDTARREIRRDNTRVEQ